MPASRDTDQDDSGGGIFDGTKFWLSHRIPDRAGMVALVKAHGGLVEPFDKRANILIADHARRDCPPNSFSWRLLTESAEAGRLVDKEPHRIGRPLTEPRPVASGEAKKSRRVPYSAADDALLAAWVSRSTQKSGNKIYQELEAVHPHHTWHSWRDRWLKHIKLLPADVVDRMADLGAANLGASNERDPPAPAPAPAPVSTAPNKQAPTAPDRRPERQTTSPPRTTQPPPARSSPQLLRLLSSDDREESPEFNEEDDALVEKYVKAMVEDGKRWNDIGIYKTLAEEYSHHAAESWKRRFADMWRDNRISTKDWNSTDRPDPRPSTGSGPRERNGRFSPTEEDELSEEDAMASSQELFPHADDPKESFYRNYSTWVNVEAQAGRTREVVMWHHIQGRKVELWTLYEAVLGQGCPIEDVEWEGVAERMGFSAASILHASEELDGCWDKYLSLFHEETSGFDPLKFDSSDNDGSWAGEGDDISEGENDSGDEDVSGGEDASRDETAPTPQRGRPSPDLSHRPGTASSHKKRRFDRGAEIPCSSPLVKSKSGPEHGTGDTSPSKRRRLLPESDKRHASTDTERDEIFYDATPTRERSLPRGTIDSSPLPVRPRGHRQSATPGSSTTGEGSRRASAIPRSSTASQHARRSNATPGSGTAGGHTGRSNVGSSAAREQTHRTDVARESGPRRERSRKSNGRRPREPSPLPAPRRSTLPPAIAPEPEPHPIIDDDGYDDGYDDENPDVIEAQTNVEQLIREGYSRSMAVEALYRTSFAAPALTRAVLRSMKRGDGVPGNKKGVWTERDDEKLRSVGAVDMAQPTENLQEHKKKEKLRGVLNGLVKKHGQASVDLRRQVLADAKEVGFTL